MDKLSQFENQKYLKIETYRKNGQAVQTPVWFVRRETEFFIWTQAVSGKVKRLRNNPKVRIMPCGQRGEEKGEWVDTRGIIVDTDEAQSAEKWFNQKYGLLFKIFALINRKHEIAVIKVVT
jgi:hypothetical protein